MGSREGAYLICGVLGPQIAFRAHTYLAMLRNETLIEICGWNQKSFIDVLICTGTALRALILAYVPLVYIGGYLSFMLFTCSVDWARHQVVLADPLESYLLLNHMGNLSQEMVQEFVDATYLKVKPFDELRIV